MCHDTIEVNCSLLYIATRIVLQLALYPNPCALRGFCFTAYGATLWPRGKGVEVENGFAIHFQTSFTISVWNVPVLSVSVAVGQAVSCDWLRTFQSDTMSEGSDGTILWSRSSATSCYQRQICQRQVCCWTVQHMSYSA